MFTTTSSVSGPLFDGRLSHEVHVAIDMAVSEVADEGVNMLRASSVVFRNPTGNWAANVETNRAIDGHVIEDNVVYNAWLEGVSSRNLTSRFKGYRIWRLTAQGLQRKAPRIAERVIGRAV